MNGKESEKRMWIFYTMLFVMIVIVLLLLTLWRPFIGLVVTIMLVLTVIVGSVIKACCQKGAESYDKNQLVKTLGEKDIISSQRLLRYSSAILAFLSLLTTANGMKSFVFETSWMAYLGSFAVQAVLVVFSLLLCRFFVQVTVLSWPTWIKRLANSVLVVFFCVMLMVSSIFSFSYIANNAYKDSWSSDRETIIQNYLLSVVYQLNAENEYRGKIILNSINESAKDKLMNVIAVNMEEEKSELNKELEEKIQIFNYEVLEKGLVDIDKAAWISAYPQYINHIEQLYASYDTKYRAGYEKAEDIYNGIVNTVIGWKNNIPNCSDISMETAGMLQKIDSACSRLQNLKDTIEDWKTSLLQNDVSTYRGTFRSESQTLIDELNSLKQYIESLHDMAENLNSDEEDNNVSEQLDQMLSQIYLLGVNEDIDVEEIIDSINMLAISASNNRDFDSEDIQNVVSLRNDLILYSEYLELKNNLNNYIDVRLKVTYQVWGDEDVKQLEGQECVQDLSEEETILAVSETVWKECRNEDFNVFYTYVKSLPDISGVDNNVSDLDTNIAVSDSKVLDFDTDTTEKYEPDSVLDEASIYQRDLLGKLTDFEKAFVYFKYQFPVMAYFSAFIAVFFDLGSFFTGCFLYITEYFEKKEAKDN